jgi:hypothetical protein
VRPGSVYPCPLCPCRVLGCAQPVLPGSAFFRSFRFKSGTLHGGNARVYHLTSPLFPSPCPESPQFPVDVFGHCGRPSILRCHSYSLANPLHSLGLCRSGMCCRDFRWHPVSSRDSARGTAIAAAYPVLPGVSLYQWLSYSRGICFYLIGHWACPLMCPGSVAASVHSFRP